MAAGWAWQQYSISWFFVKFFKKDSLNFWWTFSEWDVNIILSKKKDGHLGEWSLQRRRRGRNPFPKYGKVDDLFELSVFWISIYFIFVIKFFDARVKVQTIGVSCEFEGQSKNVKFPQKNYIKITILNFDWIYFW